MFLYERIVRERVLVWLTARPHELALTTKGESAPAGAITAPLQLLSEPLFKGRRARLSKYPARATMQPICELAGRPSCDVSVTVLWYPMVSDSNNHSLYQEDTVKPKRNWTQVTLFVVLALSSLSSVAMAAPAAAPVCGGVDSQTSFDQVQAAIAWAENGGLAPAILSQSCDESLDSDALFAGYGGESWDRFVQYSAAIQGDDVDLALNVAPVGRQITLNDQVMAAIEWSENGGPAPSILSEASSQLELDAMFLETGGESWERFEQYMDAIHGTFGAGSGESYFELVLPETDTIER
jgi:hypothetical protein